MPQPQTRIVTRTRTRARRFTACHRHPSETVTGFCALCLRDRLAGLDSSTSGSGEVEKTVVSSRRTRGHGVAPAPAPAPELRRSRSVVADKCEVVDGAVMDQRRKSCDVRARISLSDLFVVESLKLGFSDIDEVEEIRVSDECDEEIRISDECDEEIRVSHECDEEIRVSDEGEKKTMKEVIKIEIELRNKRKNFWESASVFNQKLRKWRQKQKEKKECRSKLGQFRDSQCRSEVADYGLGRRSCDTEPRFSIDANRLSVDDPRFSFDEHRASWDGYMVVRTIPRLTPMLSIVDNSINRGLNSISEGGVSSGGSGQSNSDYRGSSSSSMKSSSTKTVRLGGVEDRKLGLNARVSPANDVILQGTKLVLTEKELKDWHLNSVTNENVESNSNGAVLSSKMSVMNSSNGHKKAISSRWNNVCNLWGHKHKLDDKKNVESIPENGFDKRNSSGKLIRNASIVNSRNRSEKSCRDLVLDRHRSTRYSTSDIDSGLLRLYLTPFKNARSRRGNGSDHDPYPIQSGQIK